LFQKITKARKNRFDPPEPLQKEPMMMMDDDEAPNQAF